MSDFCLQCTEVMFPGCENDLSGITTPQDTAAGLYASALCEGCGFIQVDHEGRCVTVGCLENHNKEWGPTDPDMTF